MSKKRPQATTHTTSAAAKDPEVEKLNSVTVNEKPDNLGEFAWRLEAELR